MVHILKFAYKKIMPFARRIKSYTIFFRLADPQCMISTSARLAAEYTMPKALAHT